MSVPQPEKESAQNILKTQSLPEYGLLLFHHLCGEYAALNEKDITADTKSIVEKLQANDPVIWHDLYTFELVLVEHQVVDKLQQKASKLRTYY